MKKMYKYFISETGMFARENEKICEVFMEGEWSSPETGFGYLMPISVEEVHFLILKALRAYYHSNPEYKDKTLPGC